MNFRRASDREPQDLIERMNENAMNLVQRHWPIIVNLAILIFLAGITYNKVDSVEQTADSNAKFLALVEQRVSSLESDRSAMQAHIQNTSENLKRVHTSLEGVRTLLMKQNKLGDDGG